MIGFISSVFAFFLQISLCPSFSCFTEYLAVAELGGSSGSGGGASERNDVIYLGAALSSTVRDLVGMSGCIWGYIIKTWWMIFHPYISMGEINVWGERPL